MSKIIYLYDQNNSSSNDKIYDILLNFFKSISTNLIIIFFNYFFNDSLNTNDSIEMNSKALNKNRYIPLNYFLSSINFTINNETLYSLEIDTSAKNNFSLYLLKYNKIHEEKKYFITLPETKIIELENNISTPEKYSYNVKLYNHTLSYDIPIYKLSNIKLDFIKENKLYILFPLTLFNSYNTIITSSKIGSNTENIRKQVLKLSQDSYKNIRKLNIYNKYFTKKDYCILKDTIGEIIDYYLESLE